MTHTYSRMLANAYSTEPRTTVGPPSAAWGSAGQYTPCPKCKHSACPEMECADCWICNHHAPEPETESDK